MDEPIQIGRYVPTAGENPLQAMAYWLIKRLTEFGTNPWVVAQSCNATTINTSGTNQINSRFDIVGASEGTAHSWIVYDNPFNGSQYCFNFSKSFSSTTDNIGCEIVCSPGGNFSGGNLTNRPTSSDEYVIIAESGWSLFHERNLSFPNTSCAIYLLRSSNSECTRLLVNPNSVQGAFICMDTTTRKIPTFGGSIGGFFRSLTSVDLTLSDFLLSTTAQAAKAFLPNAPHDEKIIVSSSQFHFGVGSSYGTSYSIRDNFSPLRKRFISKPIHAHVVGDANSGYLCTFDDIFVHQSSSPHNQGWNSFFLDRENNRFYRFGDVMIPWPEPYKAFG